MKLSDISTGRLVLLCVLIGVVFSALVWLVGWAPLNLATAQNPVPIVANPKEPPRVPTLPTLPPPAGGQSAPPEPPRETTPPIAPPERHLLPRAEPLSLQTQSLPQLIHTLQSVRAKKQELDRTEAETIKTIRERLRERRQELADLEKQLGTLGVTPEEPRPPVPEIGSPETSRATPH